MMIISEHRIVSSMVRTLCRSVFLISHVMLALPALAQFPPPAGKPGSTAIHKDSIINIDWAKTCTIKRGYIDCTDTTVTFEGNNKATYGSYLYGSGPADDLVVSLGDKGTAVLTFDPPISNGIGSDFSVFENSFNDTFLELAFVEVSSDGERFVRFPSVSLTQSSLQVGTFDTLDATKINNLAGKYRMGYGTPFDLEDLSDSTNIDLSKISHVRIIDVGGSLIPGFLSFDAQGNIINDPWPTPFGTGGFDLDAVSVLDHYPPAGSFKDVCLYPNPVRNNLTILSGFQIPCTLTLYDITGRKFFSKEFENKTTLDLGSLSQGVFIVSIEFAGMQPFIRKIVK